MKKILIARSAKNYIDTVELYLETYFEGQYVVTGRATTVEEIIGSIKENKPDLIILGRYLVSDSIENSYNEWIRVLKYIEDYDLDISCILYINAYGSLEGFKNDYAKELSSGIVKYFIFEPAITTEIRKALSCVV